MKTKQTKSRRCAVRTCSAPDKCPQCGDPTIQPRDSVAYCENCGWPDEDREVDPEAVIDDVTSEVLNVVSPEGHDTEEWQQVRDAVAKAIKPLLPNIPVSHGEDGHEQQKG